ncbi:putative ribonuclease H-like domain-containing protein [Tanacetum coccineum]
MDLFSPVSMKSINKKSYCLVVTDDFSRFSWVFFLTTKDETPKILKNFITGIENQTDHKVKTIKCDNRTEFKNRIMNELCDMKGIRREFSVARTPQQNGVAERKNKTLIEAAKTMLADSKFPTTFWAEAKTCLKLHETIWVSCYNPKYLRSPSPKSSEDEVTDDAGKKNGVLNPSKKDDKSDQGEATNTNNKDANGNNIYRMFTPVNAAGSSYDNLDGSIPVKAATLPNADLPTDPLMPDLEDTVNLLNTGIFSGAYDDEDVGAETDFNNLETTMNVSPIPTTRIYKDHPKN